MSGFSGASFRVESFSPASFDFGELTPQPGPQPQRGSGSSLDILGRKIKRKDLSQKPRRRRLFLLLIGRE